MVLLATNDPITAGILKGWSVSRQSGIVGEADENGEDHYLWTYKKLEIGFNGNRIVDVNLTSEGKVKLVPNTRIAMSYSVSNEYYSFLGEWRW